MDKTEELINLLSDDKVSLLVLREISKKAEIFSVIVNENKTIELELIKLITAIADESYRLGMSDMKEALINNLRSQKLKKPIKPPFGESKDENETDLHSK